MEGARARKIEGLRHELLELHKTVLDGQRVQYERAHGRIETSNEFLGLVLHHPDFDWIRALSALIAQLDEWSEESEYAGDEGLSGILDALRLLIHPDGGNPVFARRYWKMVEDDPDVTLAHAKVWRFLHPPRPPGGSHPPRTSK
ncbi:MAG TPA: hypothetical protein VLC53_07395 [Myxococcota bacterium]|nr:hypothetical protein [Myxococcota bacterium]